MKRYEVFISYRRNGAEDFARAVYQDLRHKGIRVFLDRQDLLSGDYEEQVLRTIDNCRDVIVILPAHALDRCKEENDLFRREIARALKAKKNIIIIARQGFDFPADEELPEDMHGLSKYEAIIENPNAYDSVLDRLLQMLKDSERKHGKERLRRIRLPLIIGTVLAAVCITCGTLLWIQARRLPEAPSDRYIYPYSSGAIEGCSIVDPGTILELRLGETYQETQKTLGRDHEWESVTATDNSSCTAYLYGNLTSFPFDGKTAILRTYNDRVCHSVVTCYYHYATCNHIVFLLASEDTRAIRRLMDELYRKYNNGSGVKYSDVYMIENVAEFGGTLELSIEKNGDGVQCFKMRVYDPKTVQAATESLPMGEVTVLDYEGVEYATYSFSKQLQAKGIITNVEVSRPYSGTVNISLTGQKTFDAVSDENISALRFKARIYDENGTVIESRELSTPELKTGESFKSTTFLNVDRDDDSKTYSVEISEAD